MTSQASLFAEHAGPQRIRDFGLDVTLWENYLEPKYAESLFARVCSGTPWKQEAINMYGRKLPLPRLTCWYGDPDSVYTYSGIRNDPLPWPEHLTDLRTRLEETCAHTFNSVLLNYYRTGDDYMSWHSDDEPELGATPTIASISLGVSRVFQFRSKPREQIKRTHDIPLNNGSLLVMSGQTQQEWVHAIKKASGEPGGRVNLTFRHVSPKESRRISKRV